MQLKKQRIEWADIARALAITFVVIGHVAPAGNLHTYMYSFHVPAFFFLSGLFVNTDTTFFKHISKRFKSIMVPYYFFGFAAIIVYLLFGRFVSQKDLLTLPECLYGLLIASVKTNCLKFNLHLWFLPVLFVMNILIYPVRFIVKKIERYCKTDIRLLMCFATTVSFVISCFAFRFLHLNFFPFGADTAIKLFPFFIAGNTASEFKRFMTFTPQKAGCKLLFGFISAVLFAITAILSKLNELQTAENFHVNYTRDYQGNSLLFWSAAIFGTVAVITVSRIIPPAKPLTYTGEKTLAILVMQKFPIMVFNSVIPFTSIMINKGNIAVILTVSAITIICCLTVNIIIEKFFPFVYGKNRKKL